MRVMAMIDSLIAAGAERMAVNIANALAEAGIESHLCATRIGGPLEEFVSPDVKLFVPGKRCSIDMRAFLRLRRYIRQNGIEIIHAHSSSLFWAVMLKFTLPSLKIVWHDHFGFSDWLHVRETFYLRMAMPFTGHSFVVNEKLMNFARERLKVSESKLSFLPNFGDLTGDRSKVEPLPDSDMKPKLVCLANLRMQKDHDNLLDAFRLVSGRFDTARLYLVGGHFNDDYYRHISGRIVSEPELKGRVHILGSRNDVAAILDACDVGILSSLSEGLPVSLLEYGMTRLPVVCTEVGECSFVLDGGSCGELVPPQNSAALANAIIKVLENPEEAQAKAEKLYNRVVEYFSKDEAVKKIIGVYKSLVGDR